MQVKGNRYQWDFHKPVAVIDGEVVVLDYVFDTLAIKGFHGAVGTTYRPVSRDEYDYWTSREGIEERVEDVWRMMVSEGGETRGFNQFVDDVIRYDGEDQTAYPDQLWDDRRTEQYRELCGMDEDEAYIFEWSSGGRVFPRVFEGFDAERGDRILDKGLFDLICRYEGDANVLQTA